MALQSIKEAQEDSATHQKSAKEEDFTTKSAEVSFEWLYTILNCQSECLWWTLLIQVKWLALNLKTLEVDFITHIIYLLLYDILKKYCMALHIIRGKETQEAIGLMGDVTSLKTIYWKKNKCRECAIWPIQ